MENKFELIFAVVNSGFEDEAMKLARNCGVTGGTMINARGTAKLESENFFHIAVHPEKTILMMIANY